MKRSTREKDRSHLCCCQHKAPTASAVATVLRLLARAYDHSDLGNKRNPLNELIFVILSLQTNESRYQEVYRRFRSRFRTWHHLLETTETDIAQVLAAGGLAQQKAVHLKKIAKRLKADFGEVSLQRIRQSSTAEAEEYLCSLPGVGIKSARCVLMYALDRDVFPADVHCLRIMHRLGWIEWNGERAERVADVAQGIVPEGMRRALHIRLVQHGRAICRSIPRCAQCVLKDLCPSACA